MIQEFFKFLGQIMKLKSEKQYQQALDLIDEAAQSFIKIDLNEIMKNEDTINQILTNKLLTTDQLGMLAELLKIKADIYLDTNLRFSAITHYELSLAIYEQIHSESKDYSMDRVTKIESIRAALSEIIG